MTTLTIFIISAIIWLFLGAVGASGIDSFYYSRGYKFKFRSRVFYFIIRTLLGFITFWQSLVTYYFMPKQ